MSTNGGEQIRDEIRSLLNFDPEERVPCTQVLGIGLTPEVCENDESLRRWLVCESLRVVQEEGEDVMDAIAQAFDTAEDQCDFFDLMLPEERQTDFGPLQAQRERQQTLGGERPQAARTGRGPTRAEREAGQRPLTGAEQVGLGGDPAPERPLPTEETEPENGGNGGGEARLSDFSGFEDTGGDGPGATETIRSEIEAVPASGGRLLFHPTKETNMRVAGEVDEAIREFIDDPEFLANSEPGDRVGYAILTDTPIATNRELVAVGHTLGAAVERAEAALGGGQGNR